MDITPFIGYTASAVLIVSFMMKNVKHLRLLNTIGCGFFVAYGILLDMNWPIIIPNVFIMGLNIYHLSKSRLA